MVVALFAAVLLMAVGGYLVFWRVTDSGVVSAGDYLAELDDDVAEPRSDYEARLATPFLGRVVGPAAEGALARVAALTPRQYVERTHRQLVLAGRSHTIRAEEFAAAQVILTGAATVLALAWALLADPATRFAVLGLLLFPLIAALTPAAWLNREVEARKLAITRDLPDVLDLLAMSVEAGSGFEGALALVCQNFTSPVGEEFARTLKEMELGVSRREALQHLKKRTEVRELSNFVLALTQADALGMPLGRILHTQAAELRVKRRQWAREKAAKLPVKILFPLLVFIFPAVLVVILGPAAGSIFKAFR